MGKATPVRTSKAIALGDLARIAEGKLDGGDPKQIIHGVADIESAAAGQVTYAVSERYTQSLKKTRASAVVVPLDLKIQVGKPLIKTSNPYYAFAKILEIFSPEEPAAEHKVHPSAVIHPTAKLGKDVLIGPHVTIEAHCTVGEGTRIQSGTFIGHHSAVGARCKIFPNVTIHYDSQIGNDVIIQSGAVVGGDGYGFVLKGGQHYKIPQIGRVVIGDNVEVGSGVTIDRATMGVTELQAGVKIDNLVQIGHNVIVGRNSLLVSQVGISGSTVIGANCRFAGQSAAAGHLQIGDNTTVAARGAVTKDLAAGSFVSGFPAKPHSQEKRLIAAVNKLPKLLKRVAELEKKLGIRGTPTREESSDEG